ncbi:CHAP domain-containing protein [Sulfitobacter sp. LCG007]
MLLTAACGAPIQKLSDMPDLDPARMSMALAEVKEKQSRGQRVWCVPFARDASGIDIRGNAETWWGQARDLYQRGDDPVVGAVMAFASTRGMPMGHVAVVSEIVSPRQISIDHANWHRNRVSLKMSVIDVSEGNDWSRVRLESTPGTFGKVYPINGFIYPTDPA